jgi:prepilin peptidase CpaA
MHLAAGAALWFLPFVAPIALWVAWSDMKFMRIPNRAVLCLVAVFAVVGLVALPLDFWALRWIHLVVVLVIGFLLNMTGILGAGDAKFAAAMAPYIALDDTGRFLLLFATVILAALATHRTLRRVSAVRRALPDWASWTERDFPMGLALGPALLFYLVLAAF